jgi:hypothetical protein
MAMIPMKTMIAEKMTLLIVVGSHVLDVMFGWGRLGTVAGSYEDTMMQR